ARPDDAVDGESAAGLQAAHGGGGGGAEAPVDAGRAEVIAALMQGALQRADADARADMQPGALPEGRGGGGGRRGCRGQRARRDNECEQGEQGGGGGWPSWWEGADGGHAGRLLLGNGAGGHAAPGWAHGWCRG